MRARLSMEFRCRLGTPSGEIVEGLYEAEGEAQLRRRLEHEGLLVLSLRRRTAVGGAALQLRRRQGPGRREFILFNQELATLLKAGLPLVESLDILRRRVDNPAFRSTLDDVHERVRGGDALSAAFAAQRPPPPGVYIASLTAGEKSGSLESVIRRYVDHARLLAAVRRKTLSALIYPAVLLALSLIVVAIIVLQVVPAFADFYDGFGAELPLATRTIVAASDFARATLPAMLALLAAAAAAVWAWRRRPGAALPLDRLLLRLPGAGGVAARFATSQLARTLATLLRGGIPLVDALDVAGRSIGNRHIADQLEVVAREVREGRSLASAMDDRRIFPPVVIRMVEVGESTGALREMLDSVADFYDEEIETTLGRFMTLIEPVLLIVMGIVIAGMLFALYMPLLQLGSVIA